MERITRGRRRMTALGLMLATLAAAPSSGAAPQRPNVVLFLADDLGYGDLGCYGHPKIQTPHLDRFAQQGVRFTQFYAGGVVCSPSRTAILTGRHPYRAGVYDWIPEGSPMHLRAEEITLPKLLHDAGYATCHVGKWHLNGQFNQPGQPQPNDHGYDWWLATQNNAAPSHGQPANFARNGQAVGPWEGFSAPLIAAEAVRWLKEGRDAKKPFLLCVWTHEPHYPIKADPKFKAQYQGINDPVELEYLADVTQMDHAFGVVSAALDELKLADETIVVFTSDNGPEGNGATTPGRGSTGGLRGRKRSLEEGGIRVPGMIRWPGVTKPGTTSDVPIVNCDLLPTLLAACGVPLPAKRTLDGVDLRPALAGQAVERARPLFWLYKGRGAVRVGDWKVIAKTDGEGAQLFNLHNDPGEKTDRAAEEPARLAELRKQLVDLHAEVAAEGPKWRENQVPKPGSGKKKPAPKQ